MPKSLIEINTFNRGVNSTSSQTDTSEDHARYSFNIDPISANGRLTAVNNDSILTSEGFASDPYVAEHITSIVLNYNGVTTNKNSTTVNGFMNYGSGIEHNGGALHTLGATFDEMYDVDSFTTASSNINDANLFSFSSTGNAAGKALNLGNELHFFMFDNDNVFQTILNVTKSTMVSSGTEYIRYGFNNSPNIIRHSSQDITSGRIMYPLMLSFHPGGALMFKINEKFIYFYLVDTDNPSQDLNPINYLREFSGALPGSLTWNDRFAGAYPIEIDFNKNRTCNTLDTNIRNIIFAEIKNVLTSPLYQWSDIFSSISHTKTTGSEQLDFNVNPERLTDFAFKYNIFGLETTNPFTFGINQGLSYTKVLPYHNQIYPASTVRDTVTVNLEEFTLASDKDAKNKYNLFGLHSDNQGGVNSIVAIEDVYSNNTQIKQLSSVASNSGEFDMLVDDDKVLVGLGPTASSTPKVIMKPEDNPLTSNADEAKLGVYESALTPPGVDTLNNQFEYFYVTPIIGSRMGALDENSNTPTFNDGGQDTDYPISLNDTTRTPTGLPTNSKYTADFYPDYDIEFDNTSSVAQTLYYHLNNASGALKNLKIGQVFRCKGTNDFNDSALVSYKKMEYSATSTSVSAGDLFMFCGYFGNDTPILSFIGNQTDSGGTPAFAYGIKEGKKLYKISLVDSSTNDRLEFDGSTTNLVKDKDGAVTLLKNRGSRITTIDLADIISGNISAMYAATSPTLFNKIGLAGENQNYSATNAAGDSTQDVYYDNGYLKILYRHGVFWVADSESVNNIYKVNCIDFHQLGNAVKTETISLDFSRIPSQLHAENQQGIIRRTIEDQHREIWNGTESTHSLDPKTANESWSNIPTDAQIIGICETWESGHIDPRPGQDTAGSVAAEDLTIEGRTCYKFKAKRVNPHPTWPAANQNIPNPEYTSSTITNLNPDWNAPVSVNDGAAIRNFDWPSWRLTSGDVVRFAGFASASKGFSTGPPATVNVIDDGRAMLIKDYNGIQPQFMPYNGDMGSTNPLDINQNDTIWWNCKVWILYGKKNSNDSFKDWDLFLYNANTIDLSKNDTSLKMADRTIPYTQARRYKTVDTDNLDSYDLALRGTDLENDLFHPAQSAYMHYPGDSVFIHGGHNAPDTEANNVSYNNETQEWTYEHSFTHDTAPDQSDGTSNPKGILSQENMIMKNNDSLLYNENIWVTEDPNVSQDDDPYGDHLKVARKWSVLGVYDKSGRWSNNGKSEWTEFGSMPDDKVKNRKRYYAKGFSGGLTDTPFGSPLYFGDNIGWEVTENNESPFNGRKIKNIAGSLHPKAPHSIRFNMNTLMPPRYLSGQDGDYFFIVDNFKTPRHSVTFLSEVKGKFVKTPQQFSRLGAYFENSIELPYKGLSTFIAGGDCAKINTIEKFDNDITLHTLDDFSGHRGSLLYSTEGDVNPTSLTASGENTYVSGIAMGRPNVGGPEIENPYYYKDDVTPNGTRFPFTSRNGGYSKDSTGNHTHDIGWDGYQPPVLFNPGAGYYVYINRKWKNQSLRNEINVDYDTTWQQYNGGDAIAPEALPTYQGSMWNFQYDADSHNDTSKHSNRWHNFSNTCIGDVTNTTIKSIENLHVSNQLNISQNVAGPVQGDITLDFDHINFGANNDNLSLWPQYDSSFWNTSLGDINLWAYLNNPNFRYKMTRFATWDKDPQHGDNWRSNLTFGCNDVTVAVCTMNKVKMTTEEEGMSNFWDWDNDDTEELNFKVNNALPSIFCMDSGWSHRSTDYNVSYVCGISKKNSSLGGIAIIRTNWDAVWHNVISEAHIRPNYNFADASTDYPWLDTIGSQSGIHSNNANRLGNRLVSSMTRWRGVSPIGDQNYTGRISFSSSDLNQDGFVAPKNIGTHNIETLTLTNTSTWFPGQQVIINDAGDTVLPSTNQLRGTAIYLSRATGNLNDADFRTLTLKPFTPSYDNGWHSTEQTFDMSDTYLSELSSFTGGEIYFGKKDNIFRLDYGGQTAANTQRGLVNYPPVPSEGQIKNWIRGSVKDSSGSFVESSFFENENDENIYLIRNSYLSATHPSLDNVTINPTIADENHPLAWGNYYYKMSYEYDNAYESPLTTGDIDKVTLPNPVDLNLENAIDEDGNEVAPSSEWQYQPIEIKIKIPVSLFSNINPRVTGINIYRRYDGYHNDSYYFLENVKFTNENWKWSDSDGAWEYNVQDGGVASTHYSAINGISETIFDTSLNYGLMTRQHGYLFVSQVSHRELGNVKRYIFRSQPNNFYAFNWIDDYIIMPEVPIAMVTWNSRLYVWGKNKMYKIDPFSMVIEDEYEGISILGKNAFVKTEYGLCFCDTNNVYIHDGNRPNPIGQPILYATSKLSESYTHPDATDGTVFIEQGYIDLAKKTLENGHNPSLFYLGKKHSFVINLSTTGRKGVAFAFNLALKRWDIWDSPVPKSAASGDDSDLLICDGEFLWNYIGTETTEYNKYNKKLWKWISKDITCGTSTQDKIFRGITLVGAPSVFNYSNSTVAALNGSNNTDSIQVFVDDEQVALTVKDRFYETINLSNTKLKDGISNDTNINIEVEVDKLDPDNPGVLTGDYRQTHIRPGHLIKINDEIMLVTAIADYGTYNQLTVIRGQMNTVVGTHSTNDTIYIVAPQLKLPSGTKGKKLSLRLFEQAGYVDSIGISYKTKGLKL
tara:strand:- start:1153 stop:9141 length:7989 start_codon:yes stop_codon:yes gene_type:complete